MRAAIIGAGLAGAAAARVLAKAGVQTVLFDKGRGPGGRLSTRHVETPLGEARLDHGAQFVTAETESFRGFLQSAERANAAAVWQARLVSIDRGANIAPLPDKPRWVGTPGMNALVKFALDGRAVQFGRRAQRLRGEPGAWTVVFEDGSEDGPFDRIGLTLPPEQLIDFLARSDGDFAEIIAEARGSQIAPCWTAMAVLDAPFEAGFDGAKLLGGAVRWMARMGSRPGRTGPEAWVLQASPDWSDAFLESDADTVARQLTEEAFVRVGLPEPVWSGAHRWRFAMVVTAPGTAAGLDETGTVGGGGDWRLGGKAESAWTSGEALGGALLTR